LEFNNKGNNISKNIKKIKKAYFQQIIEKMDKKEQNKILKKTFIILVIILIGFAAVFIFMNYLNYFEYRGITFEMDKNEIKGVTLYHTSVPVIYNGKSTDYNLYLRYDPRKLEDIVPIDGNITFRKNLVLETTTPDLFCNGDWNYFQLQISNIVVFNMNLMVKNNTLKYKPAEDYMFVTINEGEKTEIKKTGENIYEINVNNCEIAPVADRFLLEALVKYNEMHS